MNPNLKTKLYKNALIGEKLYKLDRKERQNVILYLLQTKSERELGEELGIPHSTIHDWKTLRQENSGKNIHISFNDFYRKISSLDPKDITDWGRLEQIKERIESLLRVKNYE
jgi:biotin operon repressor